VHVTDLALNHVHTVALDCEEDACIKILKKWQKFVDELWVCGFILLLHRQSCPQVTFLLAITGF